MQRRNEKEPTDERVRRALDADPLALQVLFDAFVSSANAFELRSDEYPAEYGCVAPAEALFRAVRSVPSFNRLRAALTDGGPLPEPVLFERLVCARADDDRDSWYCGFNGGLSLRTATCDLPFGPSVPAHGTTFELRCDEATANCDDAYGYAAVTGGLPEAYRLLAAWSRPGPREPLRFDARLDVAFRRSPTSYGWGKSLLGGQLRAVFVCGLLRGTRPNASTDGYVPRYLVVCGRRRPQVARCPPPVMRSVFVYSALFAAIAVLTTYQGVNDFALVEGVLHAIASKRY